DQQRLPRRLGRVPGTLVGGGQRRTCRRVGGGAPGARDLGHLGQRRLQPLAGAPERGRLLPGDLLDDPRVRVGGSAAHALVLPKGRACPPEGKAHSTATAVTSHCWRSRKRATVSSVRGSAVASRLMRSGRM